MIKAGIREIGIIFGIEYDPALESFALPDRVLPYRQTVVVIVTADGWRLVPMSYSLIPSWSKEARPKFATHNARLESITEKATWREPFASKRCIVPLTHFIEPIYEGQLAGNMVAFTRTDGTMLAAAGLYDEWTNQSTGQKVSSFAIITHEPGQFVKSSGHDREPIFLSKSGYGDWLQAGKQPADKLKQILASKSEEPELQVAIDRPMKPGWEKRK